MLVKLLAPHFINNQYLPAEVILELPPQIALTPLMEGLDPEAKHAIAETKLYIFGRFSEDGALLDNPPIERPLWDPQPEPSIPSSGGPT